MAYIFQTKDKTGKIHPKFRFQYTDHTGKRRTGTGTTSKAETKKIAEKVEAEHAMIKNGFKELPKQSKKQQRRDYLEVVKEYIDWGKVQGGRGGKPWGDGHLKNRERHLPWWGMKLRLSSLADLNGKLSSVEKLIRELKSKRAGKTVSNYIDSLNSFCNYCVNRDYLESNPLEKLQVVDKAPEVKRRSLTHDEIHRLLEVVKDQWHYEIVYKVALMTGLRLNELRQLSVSDLDKDRSCLILHAKWTKNRKDGVQLIPQSLIRDLEEFIEAGEAKRLYGKYYKADKKMGFPENPLLFVSSHSAEKITKHYKEAGIPKLTGKGKVDFHALRVTYINLIIGSQANAKTAQSLARHANIDMTMNVYGRTDDDALRTSVEQLGSTIYTQSDIDKNVNYSKLDSNEYNVAGSSPVTPATFFPSSVNCPKFQL